MVIKIQSFKTQGVEDLETQVNGFVNQLRRDGIRSTRHYSHNRTGAVDNYVVVIEYEVADPSAYIAEPAATRDGNFELSIQKHTRAVEIDLVKKALAQTEGNRTRAASLLGISHRALLYKLKDYGIRS